MKREEKKGKVVVYDRVETLHVGTMTGKSRDLINTMKRKKNPVGSRDQTKIE